MKVNRVLPVAQKRLITVKSDALLIDAARLLASPQRNLVIVCDGGRMAGVVTKTDVVSRISHCTGCSCTMPVTQAMTKDVKFCRPEDQLNDAWTIIKQHGLTNIPIVDQDSKPVGVLNAKDALRTLLEDVQYEEQLLYDYVMGVGYR